MLLNKYQKISILGAGWLGYPLAIHLQKKLECLILASSRNPITLKKLEDLGISPCFLDISDNSINCSNPLFFDTDLLIINIPPKRIPNIETYHLQQFKQLTSYIKPQTHIIFISSTSVYPPMGDVAVSENCTTPPNKISGKALLRVEKHLEDHFSQVLILRSGGLFGENRSIGAFLSKKTYTIHPNERVNLVHQQDLIDIIERSIVLKLFNKTFNVVSTEHPLKQELYQKKAKEQNLAPPKFIIDNNKPIKLICNKNINKAINTLSWQHSKKHLTI